MKVAGSGFATRFRAVSLGIRGFPPRVGFRTFAPGVCPASGKAQVRVAETLGMTELTLLLALVVILRLVELLDRRH